MTGPTSSRRAFLLSAPAALLMGRPAQAAAHDLTVYKTPWCGCCSGWVTHMRRAGFAAKVVELEDLAPIRARFGIRFEQSSCHTAVAGGYGIEGHVPPADVLRLLRERPKARALIVPGMPAGSPGMETPQGRREPYEVLLLLPNGATRVFARHA
jgi:hypothetical protein